MMPYPCTDHQDPPSCDRIDTDTRRPSSTHTIKQPENDHYHNTSMANSCYNINTISGDSSTTYTNVANNELLPAIHPDRQIYSHAYPDPDTPFDWPCEHWLKTNWASTPSQSLDSQTDGSQSHAATTPTHRYATDVTNTLVLPPMSVVSWVPDVDADFLPPLTHIARLVDSISNAQSEVAPETDDADDTRQHTEATHPDLSKLPIVKPKRHDRRIEKPPFSYTGMCVMAIENADDNKLTITGMRNAIEEMFPFFQSGCTQWLDSVRSTLSRTDYLYSESVYEKGARTAKKVYYWRVDLTRVNPMIFRRQKQGCGGDYQPTLHEQLGLPEVTVPPRTETQEIRVLMAESARVTRNITLLMMKQQQSPETPTQIPSEVAPETDDADDTRQHTEATHPDLSKLPIAKPKRQDTRLKKPPFSYTGMCVMAIENADDNKLTITGVRNAIEEMFPFFQNGCTQWLDSVRTTLSRNDSFYSEPVYEKGVRKAKKVYYWRVDLTRVNPVIFRRHKQGCRGDYQPTLHEQLGVPEVTVPPRTEKQEIRGLMAASARSVRSMTLLLMKQQQSPETPTQVPSSPTDIAAPHPGHAQKSLTTDPAPRLIIPYRPTGNHPAPPLFPHLVQDYYGGRTDGADYRQEDSLKHGIENLLADITADTGSQSPPSPLAPLEVHATDIHKQDGGPDNTYSRGSKRKCTDTGTNTLYKRPRTNYNLSNTSSLCDNRGYSPATGILPEATNTPQQCAWLDQLAPRTDWYQAAAFANCFNTFRVPHKSMATLLPTPMYPGQSMCPEMYPSYRTWPYTSVPATIQQTSLHLAFDQYQDPVSQELPPQYTYPWFKTPNTSTAGSVVDLSNRSTSTNTWSTD